MSGVDQIRAPFGRQRRDGVVGAVGMSLRLATTTVGHGSGAQGRDQPSPATRSSPARSVGETRKAPRMSAPPSAKAALAMAAAPSPWPTNRTGRLAARDGVGDRAGPCLALRCADIARRNDAGGGKLGAPAARPVALAGAAQSGNDQNVEVGNAHGAPYHGRGRRDDRSLHANRVRGAAPRSSKTGVPTDGLVVKIDRLAPDRNGRGAQNCGHSAPAWRTGHIRPFAALPRRSRLGRGRVGDGLPERRDRRLCCFERDAEACANAIRLSFRMRHGYYALLLASRSRWGSTLISRGCGGRSRRSRESCWSHSANM